MYWSDPNLARARWQWQPGITAHDPSPPITLEDGAQGPPIVEGAATLTGVGALVAAAMLLIPASVTATGSGALAASAIVEVRAAASLSGDGALAAGALVEVRAASSPAGDGGLTSTAILYLHGQSDLAGAFSFAAAGESMGQGAGEPPVEPVHPAIEAMYTGDVPLLRLWNRAPPRQAAPIVAATSAAAALSGASSMTAEGVVIPNDDIEALGLFLLTEEP